MGSRGLSAKRAAASRTGLATQLPAQRFVAGASGIENTIVLPAVLNGTSGRDVDGTPMGPTAASVRVMNAIEAKIYSDPIESFHVVDDNGIVRFVATGKVDEVEISAGIPVLKNAVATHNHPGGTSISQPDIMVAATHDVLQMRVVGNFNEVGKRYVYTIDRPARGWQNVDVINVFLTRNENLVRAKFQKNIDRLTRKAGFNDFQKAQKRAIDIANAYHQHLVIKGLAKDLGWNYSRKEVK